MTFGPKDLAKLLARTDLSIPFESFLHTVEQVYELGRIYSYAPILEGYEDANIRFTSEKGEFVLKIFSKEKTLAQAKSYVDVLQEAKKRKIPFTKLVKGKEGYLSTYKNGHSSVYYFITHFFNGKNFEWQTPYLDEIKDVTNILARLNTITIPVTDSYDSWSNKNLVREYTEYENHISQDIRSLLFPVVQELRQLDTTSFSTSIVHGDFQRKHVLKNKEGEYCVLDLGCLRYDAKVYDLSVHLAWFCLGEDTWKDKEQIIKVVLDEYTSINQLATAELSSLPLLTKASYAAYLLRTSLLVGVGDTSEETHVWLRQAKNMLQLMNEWGWKI